ncbi:MAG: hypothetical protein WBX15_09160 [Thermoanaerobaculia bacterium]
MKTRSILAILLLSAALPLAAQTTEGSWTTTVASSSGSLQLEVVPPLGKDQPLNCHRHVIPVKFAPAEAEGGTLLVSDLSDTDTSNDASSITFTPTDSSFTVSDLTNLTAVYDVVEGNCGGGALRWSITTTEGNVFVYYGEAPNFTDCSGAEGQSGVNLLSMSDMRVDSSQVYAGTQYNTWDAFVAANPDLVIQSISLVADAGWFQADQVQSFQISSATVNDNTYTGQMTECDLPDATIQVTDQNGTTVDVKSVQGDGTAFRVDDCQYVYNLVNPGPGTYTVDIMVGGDVAASSTFTVSCSRR